MGGHAIKKVPIVRLKKNDYDKIKNDVVDKLKSHTLDFPNDVPGKEDFGDLDIIYLTNEERSILDDIKKIYNPPEIVINGNIISIAYKYNEIYFQVDFIKSSNLIMDKFFLSYGDVGGILGRIAKHYALTFGGEGLWLVLFADTVNNYLHNTNDNHIDKTYNLGKIVLSNDPAQICEYLDLDYGIYQEGFSKVDDIYDWIIKSSWFDKEIFRILNNFHRKRANMRPMYQGFINYINVTYVGSEEENEIQVNKQMDAIKYFKKIDQLDLLIKEYQSHLLIKEKFNGNKLMAMGMDPKQLGTFIKKFKEYIHSHKKINFEFWLEQAPVEEIDDTIKLLMSDG